MSGSPGGKRVRAAGGEEELGKGKRQQRLPQKLSGCGEGGQEPLRASKALPTALCGPKQGKADAPQAAPPQLPPHGTRTAGLGGLPAHYRPAASHRSTDQCLGRE
jgi:hypothetical protein